MVIVMTDKLDELHDKMIESLRKTTPIKSKTLEDRKMELLPKIADELIDTLIRKGKDYGGSWSNQGLKGIYCRLSDKTERLKTLVWLEKKAQVTDENVEDTLMDLAGYALLAVSLIRMHKEGIVDKDRMMRGV